MCGFRALRPFLTLPLLLALLCPAPRLAVAAGPEPAAARSAAGQAAPSLTAAPGTPGSGTPGKNATSATAAKSGNATSPSLVPLAIRPPVYSFDGEIKAGKLDFLPRQRVTAGVKDALLQEKIVLARDKGETRLLVGVHYPQNLGNAAADAAVAEKARQFFATDRAYLEEDDVIPGEISRYPLITTYSITRSSPRFVSILFQRWQFTGGAHPNWVYAVQNFDLTTGRELDIDDLFPAGESILPALLNIMAGISATSIEPQEAPDNDEEAVRLLLPVDEDDVDSRRILLTPEGFRVVFSPYEKASFSHGALRIDIPREKLLTLGVPPIFWESPGKR